jgi:outer membrane protein OmpA-like peptidoglycan-associated protein
MKARNAFASAIFTFVLSLLVGIASPVHARDADYERLVQSLDSLAADPKLGTLAPAQIERARVAVQAYKDAGRSDRPYMLYVAERRIDIARASAQAVFAESERANLQRENDQLQLAAARRDAAQARRELEQQRLQAQIRAEESERLAREAETARAEGEQASQAADAARAEAAQAKRMADLQAKAAALAKKEAELSGSASATPAPAAAPAPRRMTLADSAFVRSQPALSSAGSARIGSIVDFVNGEPGARIRIEASAAGNRELATARAQTVRDALVSAGVSAGRIASAGASQKGGKASQVEIRLEGAD